MAPIRRFKMPYTEQRFGQTVRTCYLIFWAEHGQICLEDDGCGDFFVLSVPEWENRTIAVAAEVPRVKYADERIQLQRTVANMIECRVEAKRQGDPTDPKVVEWILKHRPFKRTMSNGFEHGVMPKLTPGGLVPPKPTLRKLLLPDHML